MILWYVTGSVFRPAAIPRGRKSVPFLGRDQAPVDADCVQGEASASMYIDYLKYLD